MRPVTERGSCGALAAATFLLSIASGCGTTAETSGDDPGDGSSPVAQPRAECASDLETAEAATVISSVKRFAYVAGQLPGARDPQRPAWMVPGTTLSVLEDATVDCFQRDGAWLRPDLESSLDNGVVNRSRKRAATLLPLYAAQPFRVADASGVAIAVRIAGARDVPAELSGGFVVYRHAVGEGGDVIHRVTDSGTEDFIVYATPPAEAKLSYEITLEDAVAGLRLTDSALEFLDVAGTPQLRVRRPVVVAHDGSQPAVDFAIDGCAVDSDPREPWERPTVPTGSRECTLTVTWNAEPGHYPLMVDPAWTTTGSMVTARRNAQSATLPNGRVLVAGGNDPRLANPMLSSAELYDPTTGTWSPTGTMNSARTDHTLTLLSSGDVLAAGGADNTRFATRSAEVFSPSTGTWSSTGLMSVTRLSHTATALLDGRVLVAGGFGFDGVQDGNLARAELFEPATGTWGATASLSAARQEHAAVRLANGRVLISGGYAAPSYLSSAELFDPSANGGAGGWASIQSMQRARAWHTLTRLTDGRVLATGGDGVIPTEIFDPVTAAWTLTGQLAQVRSSHTSTLLPDGRVLAAGGFVTTATTELFDPIAGAWASAGQMANARGAHVAELLANGKVLVASGAGGPAVLSAAELFDPKATGLPCRSGSDCATTFCVDGRCCNTSCGGNQAGDCVGCSLAVGATADGTCSAVRETQLCGAPNGEGHCVGGGCSAFACNPGFGSCDGDPFNGCETNVLNNVAHCGGCGIACSAANGTATCSNGQCAITCNLGFGNCDNNPGNGCETDLRTSLNNCGQCGAACGNANGTPACVAGACNITCQPGFSNCDGLHQNGCEVDTTNDPNHCGSCGNRCGNANGMPDGPFCVASSCRTLCLNGFRDCNGNPADGCETRWQAPFPCSCPGACNDGDACTDDTCKSSTGCKNTRRDRCGNGACEGPYESTCACADCGPDQDGDKLPDRWETLGLDTDCNGTPDYTLPQADPTRPNVYVELDYFKSADHSHALTQESVDLVVAAFARRGIILRIEIDEALRHREVIRFDPEPGEETTCSVGSDWVNFDSLKKLHFDPRKRAAYRYAIFGHYLNCLPTATLPALGKAELLGNDFVPTDKGPPVLLASGPLARARHFMHELGHTFNLHHGGVGDSLNNKPNYLSIMNARFGFIENQDGSIRLDYSTAELPRLDENALNENLGIQGGTDFTSRTCPGSLPEKMPGTGAIDWNCSNTIESNVQFDINRDGNLGTLNGAEDWSRLQFAFQCDPEFTDGVHTGGATDTLEYDNALSQQPIMSTEIDVAPRCALMSCESTAPESSP